MGAKKSSDSVQLAQIGKKIRYARTEAGLSQKELASQLQLSDKAISSYEVGRAQPGVEVLKEIGVATGRSVQYFIDDDPKRAQQLDFAHKIKKIETDLAELKKALKESGYRV